MLKKLLILILVLALLGGGIAFQKYQEVFAPNVPAQLEDPYVFIPSGSNYEEVVNILNRQKILIDQSSFDWLAERMKYKKTEMRAGKFKVSPGWSNRQLISHLRGGKQSTVKVVLNNERLIDEVAGKAARFIETDSLSLLKLLTDEAFLNSKGYSRETIMTLFIPNTYDFFWNTTPIQFFERMEKENKNFWSKNHRLDKAKELGMTKGEVYTLASIVERESNKKSERPTVAGLYLNRLKKGILLQADPTVVFANKDFGLRRVLNKHLEFDSPYNTYLYPGLPPGPISMASINSIESVLEAEKHDYIFMCAKPGEIGYHAFAKTLAGHSSNAKKYHRWLNQQGIR